MTEENYLALGVGYQLNQYTIDKVLGQGGFGIVYKAHHIHLDETVVIKEFLPVDMAGRSGDTVTPHSSQSSELFNDSMARFINEGRVLVKLSHQNIVRCRDLFQANGTAYLVMDFEDGLPFNELLASIEQKGESYSEEQLLNVFLALAGGLDFIHQQGVLHRDIKPGNVFIRRSDNTPVLLDFGAAKQQFAEVSQSRAPYTEFYAPIEQSDPTVKATAAIDIHAFGGLMYRAVTGQTGPKAESRALNIATGKTDPLTPAAEIAKGKYSPELLSIIDRCLAFQASDRPASMQEVIAELTELLSPAPEVVPVQNPTQKQTRKQTSEPEIHQQDIGQQRSADTHNKPSKNAPSSSKQSLFIAATVVIGLFVSLFTWKYWGPSSHTPDFKAPQAFIVIENKMDYQDLGSENDDYTIIDIEKSVMLRDKAVFIDIKVHTTNWDSLNILYNNKVILELVGDNQWGYTAYDPVNKKRYKAFTLEAVNKEWIEKNKNTFFSFPSSTPKNGKVCDDYRFAYTGALSAKHWEYDKWFHEKYQFENGFYIVLQDQDATEQIVIRDYFDNKTGRLFSLLSTLPDLKDLSDKKVFTNFSFDIAYQCEEKNGVYAPTGGVVVPKPSGDEYKPKQPADSKSNSLNKDKAPKSSNKVTMRAPSEIYQTHCLACHGVGIAGAPKLSDSKSWKQRLTARGGIQGLYQSTMQGRGVMPVKGGCFKCSEAEIKATVDYMLSKSP